VALAGLTFIGPPAPAIRATGDKTEARRRMQAAGVPIVPGTTRPVADHVQAKSEAARLGLPVLLKAIAGGGGKGMRLIREEGELESAFETAQSEALKAFGAGELYVEKYLERPRHIEVRVHAGALQPRGHAIECRITAEDPFNDFLPATGVIRHLQPPSGPGVRWDAGVEAGNEVTLFYDPLLAKLIVWGDTRATALQRMRRALRELVIVGLPSSQSFHLRVMADPEFQRGDVDVTYFEPVGQRLLAADLAPELAEIVGTGPSRVAASCPHYVSDRCSGCQLQHLSYDAQLAAKQAIVGDALRRIGKLDVPDPEIVEAVEEWRYRAKVSLAVEGGRG